MICDLGIIKISDVKYSYYDYAWAAYWGLPTANGRGIYTN